MVYPPSLATNDGGSNWSYLHSFSHHPFNQNDLDAPNYKNYAQNAPAGQGNQLGGQSRDDASQIGQKGGKSGSKKEPIDKFATLIDAEAPRFAKQRRENYKAWESSVQGLSSAIHRSIESFYDRKTNIHDDIVQSMMSRREEGWPQADTNEMNDEIKELAVAAWPFQSLPGTKPATQWPTSLSALAERLDQLAPCSLWNEPLDIVSGGPEFFSQAKNYIMDNASKLMTKDQVEGQKEIISDTALALSCHFGVSVQTGNHQLIMEALDFHFDLSQQLPQDIQTQIFSEMKPRAIQFVKQMQEVLEKRQQQRLHHLQMNSVHGVISIAKYVSFVNLTEFTSSITIDNEGYLYLWISIPQRGNMYKIGTGEAGTVAGKVYNQASVPEYEGEATWVYCQGKLWARRLKDVADLGHLLIFDPQTFKQEGTARINLAPPSSSDLPGGDSTIPGYKQTALTAALNRFYPLLTDGKNLFVVTMNLVQKRRRVKDSMRKLYQQFQEYKKKQALLRSTSISSQPAKPDPKKDAKRAEGREDRQKRRQEDREKKLLEEMAQFRDQEDKALQERMMKELSRQKLKEAKAEAQKKSQQGRIEHGHAPPGEDPNEQLKQAQEAQSVEHYKVCEFYVHEFDIQASGEKEAAAVLANQVPDSHELFDHHPMAVELFTSFSSFFSIEECYKALKSCNNDIVEAAAWLVDEGEQERGKKALIKKRTVLIAESELVNQQTSLQPIQDPGMPPPPGGKKPIELDIVVKEGSVLGPNCINAGKWSVSSAPAAGSSNKQYISYHNITTDNGSIKVFSISQEDMHIINESSKDLSPKEEEHKAEDAVVSPEASAVEKQLEEAKGVEVDVSTIKELDLYDSIKLHGTFAKTIKLQRTGANADFGGHNTYLIYDHSYKKFYVLLLGSQARYIAVAEDLTEMYQLLKETAQSDISSQFSDIVTLSDLALKTMKTLSEISKARFTMPWRWRTWSANYSLALQHWATDQLEISGTALSQVLSENSRGAIEQRKKQMNKLTTRLEKVQAHEKQVERDSIIGIPWDQKVLAKKGSKTNESQQPNQPTLKQEAPSRPKAKKVQKGLFKSEKNLFDIDGGSDQDEGWGGSRSQGLFGSPYGNAYGQKKEAASAPSSELVLPKEKIIIYRECTKMYAYCINGSFETLQKLFKIVKDCQNEELSKTVITQILQWVLVADTLTQINTEGAKLLDDVRDFLIEKIQKVDGLTQRVLLDNLWRILIIGWPLFIKNTSQQYRVFQLILTQSSSPIYTRPSKVEVIQQTLQLDASTGKLTEDKAAKKVLPTVNFYQKVLINQITPIQLFYTRFFNYHASYYPLEVLQQSKVIQHVVLIERGNFPDARTCSHYDQERSDANIEPHTHLTPRYQIYRHDQDPFQYYRQAMDVSLAQCKEYQTKQIENGTQINHMFFSVPNHLMFLKHHEILEDLEKNGDKKQNIDLEDIRVLYSDEGFSVGGDKEYTPKELHEAKLRQLDTLRRTHCCNAEQLLDMFKSAIKSGLNELTEDLVQWDTNVSSYLMASYNELIRQSLARVDWSRSRYCDLAIDQIRFVDDMLALLAKKTNNYKTSPLKVHQYNWFILIKDLLSIVMYESYSCVDEDNFIYLSKKSTESYLSIIENFKLFFQYTKEEVSQEDPQVKKKVQESILDHMLGFMQEGTDFTLDKVFETPHPYPKGDYTQKDTIQINKAIAYSIELDRRCQTEFSSDVMQIQSSDHAFWVNDSFGTNIRLHGRSNFKLPFMVLGNKINIEFKSYQNSGKKQPPKGARGGFMNHSGRGEGEDTSQRWGFKVIIRPIYGETIYGFKSNIKKEHFNEVTHRIGLETTYSLISLINQCTFLTSKMTQAVIQANAQLPSDLSQSLQVGGRIVKNPQPIDLENLSKFIPWHLFKGGVKTDIIGKLHNPRVLEETLKHLNHSKDQTQDDLLKAIESFKDNDAAHSTKEEGLRNRRTSISNLMKDVEKIDTQSWDFKPDEDYWSADIKEIMRDSQSPDSFIKRVTKKVRELVPYNISYQNERRRPNFKKEFQEEWNQVEEILILAMLYHSLSLEETKKFLGQSQLDSKTKERIEEKLRLIGTQLNDVLSWMQSRLQGQQDFQSMLRDIVDQGQVFISQVVEKKRIEEEENLRKKALAEEEQKKKAEEKRIQDEQDKSKELAKTLSDSSVAQAKKGPVLSKEKSVNKAKRKNVVKHVAMKEADLLKLKAKKKPSASSSKTTAATKEETKEEEGLEPMKKVEEEKQESHPLEEKVIKILELSPSEEREIKHKIYMKVYEEFLQIYQGNLDRVKPLCQLLNIALNPEDPNESLKAIFKRVKAKLRSLIDFDGDLPIRETLDIEELKLESPYKEISKEVKGRLLFLLELNPSVDYHSKVIQVDFTQIQKRLQQLHSSASQASQEDISSQHKYTDQSSIQGAEEIDTEILEPLGIQRSQSVQVGIQPALTGISGVSQAVLAQQKTMKEDDIVNWIDNYRKWRQWNRQHKLLNKGGQGGLDFFDEDLTSPYCSPLFSVVSFAKSSKIQNPESLKKIFISHQLKAALRIEGLKYQEQLFKSLQTTPYQRLIVSNLSSALQESTFNGIETCGEILAQSINEQSRLLVKQLMNLVIAYQSQIENLILKRNSATKKAINAAAQAQQQIKLNPPAEAPKQSSQISAQEKAALQQRQLQNKALQQREEMADHQILKQLVQILNDLRILLSNIYTREYVLESLRQSQSSNIKETLKISKSQHIGQDLTFDIVKDFLKSIVELMLQFNTGSSQLISKQSPYASSKMQFTIAYCCKLILNQFMTDKSMMRSQETHRMLQESLLDIIVDKLERLCGLKKKSEAPNLPVAAQTSLGSPLPAVEGSLSEEVKVEETVQQQQSSNNNSNNLEEKKPKSSTYRPPGYKLNRISHQDEIVQLMKLLSEVIRISNDHQQHIQTLQQVQAGITEHKQQESYFLSEGSDKVMRCASILAFMMHHVEVPIIMRQTIKCAKLFFKLVEFKKLKLHDKIETCEIFEKQSENEFLIETLRKIGGKISNTAREALATKDLSKPEQLKDEEKLYVVYGNINSNEEDFSFLITALYHWETLYPSFTLDFPKDPAEIVVKSAPKEEEKKKEGDQANPAVAGQQPPSDADLQLNIQEADPNVDLQELLKIQQQQMQQIAKNASVSRGSRGPMYAGPPGGNRRPEPSKPFIPAGGDQAGLKGLKGSPSFIANMLQQQDGLAPGSKAFLAFNTLINQNIKINKLDQIFDEVVKQTWEDSKEEDSEEEKLRKLNERNYNVRAMIHLTEAKQLSAILYSRYSAPLTEPLPYLKAIEFSNILQKAYKCELEPIQINPYFKDEVKNKKLADSKTVAQHFPLIAKTFDVPVNPKDIPPHAAAPITIAPKRLVVSLAEVNLSTNYEKFVEAKHPALRTLEKNPIEGFKCNIISQSIRRQGSSISVIIQEFITLIRSLINSPKQLNRATTTPLVREDSEMSYMKQQSFMKMKKSQETVSLEIIDLINSTIEQLAKKNWSDLSLASKQVIYGLLAVIGGWNPPMRTGQPVQVQINTQWVDATIVDDGLGKKRISVLLDDDDTLTIQKVPIHQARPIQKYEWPFDSELSAQINQEKVCEAIISIYNQIKSKVKTEQSSTDISILNEEFLILMLLKVSSQLKWYFMDRKNPTFGHFMQILNDITKDQQSEGSSTEEDKTRTYWEKSLIDSWERLIDRDEQKNFDFFVIKENLISELDKLLAPEKNASLEEEKKEEINTSSTLAKESSGKLRQELQSQYQDNEYVQPLSSYLRGLPEAVVKKNTCEANLKLLCYWERNIIPKIVEFVKTTYKPWEMKFYFEQLRYHLRNADTAKAFEDAMVMCEKKIPQGCIIPDDNYDWSCKMIDECIVDTWALAKFKPQKITNQLNQQNQAQNSGSGETSFPLLNKLVNFGIDEIVVLIKAVDQRGNVVLAEHQDPDTMQVHSIWIPVNHLNDLHNPLPPRSVGFTVSTLMSQFNNSVARIESVYARQTLVQFFHAFQQLSDSSPGGEKIFQLPSHQIELQEIISWSVWEHYSSAPVDGWIQDLSYALPLKPAINEENFTSSTSEGGNFSSSSLQELVHESSEKLINEQIIKQTIDTSSQAQMTLNLVKGLFEKTIMSVDQTGGDNTTEVSEDTKIVQNIVDWCIMNWYNISERIRSGCVVFDLCQQYDAYIKKPTQSKANSKQFQSVNLLPLHEVIANFTGEHGQLCTGAIGNLLMFKKNAAYLTPTSKIQFYSDANKVNLISEISAGTEGLKDLPPMLLNHGSIWVNFDAGSTALLPKDMQIDQQSCLPCAVVQIPNTWTVCCWLTEMITNSLLLNVGKNFKFSIDIYEKLIGALTSFYEEAKAPSMLKSIVFNLLSRLIIKLRHIYIKQSQYQKYEWAETKELLQSHLKRLFLKQDFLSTLLSELLVHKEMEEHGHQLDKQQGSMLYSAFVQDCVELILTISMPTIQNVTLDSYKDLFDSGSLEIPEWLRPLIKALYFMQYFSGEMKQLSKDVLKEIHDETKPNVSQLDQIIILQGIPSHKVGEDGNKLYTKEILLSDIIKLVNKHGFRILKQNKDIIFSDDLTSIAIIVDGIDHMSLLKEEDQEGKQPEPLSEDESEEDKGQGKQQQPKVEDKKEELPTEYNCPVCTLLNPVSASMCGMCDTPRPPMEQIIADFRAANAPASDEKKPEKEEGGEVAKKTVSVIEVKLEALGKDLARIIMRREKQVQKEKEKEQKEKLERLKKEEEEKKKEEEIKEEKKQDTKKPDEHPKEEKKAVAMIVRAPRSQSGSMDSIIYPDDDGINEDSEEGRAFRPPSRAQPRGVDHRQRLIDLGIDISIIDGEPELAEQLAAVMLADLEAEEASQRQKAREEEEKRKKEAAEEEKKKKKAEQERLEAEARAAGLAVEKVQYTKLRVAVGQHQLFEGDPEVNRFVFKILKDRLQTFSLHTDASQQQEEFQFSPEVVQALKGIHESYKCSNLQDMNPLPQDSQLLEDFEISQKSIGECEFTEFVTKCLMLAESDIKDFVRLLESQGYDLWFQRAFHSSYIIPESSSRLISIKLLEKLKYFIEVEMCKETKSVVTLQPNSLRLLTLLGLRPSEMPEDKQPLNYYDDSLVVASHPELLDDPRLTQHDVRYLWALLRVFNKYLAPTVPFINTSQSTAAVVSDLASTSTQHVIHMRLSAYMSATRNLCLMNVKFDLRHMILEKTSIQRENPPKLYFERLKIAHKNVDQNGEENGERQKSQLDISNSLEPTSSTRKEKQKLEFIFNQAYDQIKDLDLALLRPKKPQGTEPHLAFSIVFKGENVVGEGGPYRQFFSDISQELQPLGSAGATNGEGGSQQKQLGLLMPSPNNKTGTNIGKTKFILCPSRTSSSDLSLFEFLGILMGVCIRTGANMTLDLPQIVWKQLTGQKVSYEDLIEIDLGFWKLMSFMLTANKKMYDESIFETWTVMLSDQETVVELRDSTSKDQRVAYEDRLDYIKQALYTRLNESSLQCAAIKRGISKIIPEALLNMVTYSELETWVCGKAFVDIDLLKRHTDYGSDDKTILTEESRRIKYFWEVLRSFSEEDKQKFIKFCWAQPRIPANDEEFERRSVRFLIKPAAKSEYGDGALPKADTCFFNFQLPDYSTKDIMRQRILLAIYTDCDSMNAEEVRMGDHDNGGRRMLDDDGNNDYDDDY